MQHSPFEPWHDFHILMGTAAATLVGLMFVAASVGTGLFTEERQVGLRTFLSPTVVAFSVVLEAALVGIAPLARMVAAIILGGTGLLGMLYSWRVWHKMVEHGMARSIDLEDRTWYATIPALGYLVFGATGALLFYGHEAAPSVLALAMSILLLAGIRNAWDMTTWAVLRRRD